MKKLNKKGFTIVELVIVIAVIGVLAAILIPTFSGVIGNAKDKAAVKDAQTAYTEYLIAHGAEDEVAENFVYNYGEKRFVVIKNGQVDSTMYADATTALAAINGESGTLKLLNSDGSEFTGTAAEDTLYAVGTPTGGEGA